MAERAKTRNPNTLTIAGVDPSGGAGLLADVKAMSACGAYACGVVTALTAQSTRGVFGVEGVDPAFVKKQLEVLFDDIEIDAVKIGMLADAPVIEAVASVLEARRPRWVVIDPVMVAKSKDRLLAVDAVTALKNRLLPLASIITPNLPEAAELLGRSEIEEREKMPELAQTLLTLLPPESAVLLKGGHLRTTDSPDLFMTKTESHWLEGPRLRTKNTHGTGCTLSSAIAALLPQSGSVFEAVRGAKRYIMGAIAHADKLHVGSGFGPTNHFWKM